MTDKPTSPDGDIWRVDVAGYSCNVRGKDAKDHLERVNHQLAVMKMALHRVALHGCTCAPEREIDPEERECAACIAEGALG